MQASIPALATRGVTHRFRDTLALSDLSLSVPAGQIVGLLGRNGAGKSTLLRIASGQLRQQGGEILLFDAPVFDNAAALSELCMIGDTPDFGALPNIPAYFDVCRALFPHWQQEEALRIAEQRFDLPLKKKLKGFSRGMQTAVQLTVGLCSGAALTVFDEPSLGLDAVMRERFYDLLLEKRGEGRTFVLSTHLIDEVARVLDSAVLIDAGRLLRQGSIASLTEEYLSVSGAPAAVIELTEGLELLKEESLAGTLARHLHVPDAERRAALSADARVQTAPVPLQRLFVFLTEQKEAERHAKDE